MPSLAELRRSTTDRKLTGLCGGIARQWQVDPLLVRVLAVLLTLSAGLGLVAYVFGSLLVRSDDGAEPPVHRLLPASKRWSNTGWIVAFVVCCAAVLMAFGSTAPIGIVPGVIVLAVWYFGFRRTSTPPPPPPGQVGADLGADPLAGPDTPFRVAARAWRERQADYLRDQQGPAGATPPLPRTAPRMPFASAGGSGSSEAPGAPWAPYEPTGPAHTLPATRPYGARADASTSPEPPAGIYTPASPLTPTGLRGLRPDDQLGRAAAAPYPTTASPATARRRPASPALRRRVLAARRLMLATLVVTGLALAGLGVADGVGLVQVGVVGYLATALLVVGLGVVVSSWVGRSAGLVTLGVLLLVVTASTAAATGPLSDQAQTFVAPREISYTSLAQLPTAPVHFDSGSYRIDLSAVDVSADHKLTIGVDAGSLTVTVPADTRVRVEASVDFGQITVGDRNLGGSDASLVHSFGPANGPLLTLVLHADFGQIRVVTT